jgi:hypothetical protein
VTLDFIPRSPDAELVIRAIEATLAAVGASYLGKTVRCTQCVLL